MPKQGLTATPPRPGDRCCTTSATRCASSAEFADPYGVDVLLEMHGQFNYWGFARAAVELAGHPRVGSSTTATCATWSAARSPRPTSRVRHLVRHVHMHAFTRGYPYPELFGLLVRDGYTGYLSSEIDEPQPTAQDYLVMYAHLFRAWHALAAAGGTSALPAQAATSGVVAIGRPPERKP